MITPLFIGTTELFLVGGIALLLFGGKKLPEMMRGLGQGVKEFKDGMNEMKKPLDDAQEAINGEHEQAENEQHEDGTAER